LRGYSYENDPAPDPIQIPENPAGPDYPAAGVRRDDGDFEMVGSAVVKRRKPMPNKYVEYEIRKARLFAMGPSPLEYEQAIMRLWRYNYGLV
jgi:hypothetical protein